MCCREHETHLVRSLVCLLVLSCSHRHVSFALSLCDIYLPQVNGNDKGEKKCSASFILCKLSFLPPAEMCTAPIRYDLCLWHFVWLAVIHRKISAWYMRAVWKITLDVACAVHGAWELLIKIHLKLSTRKKKSIRQQLNPNTSILYYSWHFSSWTLFFLHAALKTIGRKKNERKIYS